MTHSKPRYSLAEAQALLGISRPTIYVRARQGRLALHRDGARTFVTATEIDRYLSACDAAPLPADRSAAARRAAAGIRAPRLRRGPE